MPDPISPPPITVTFLIALCTALELEKFLTIPPNWIIFYKKYCTTNKIHKSSPPTALLNFFVIDKQLSLLFTRRDITKSKSKVQLALPLAKTKTSSWNRWSATFQKLAADRYSVADSKCFVKKKRCVQNPIYCFVQKMVPIVIKEPMILTIYGFHFSYNCLIKLRQDYINIKH